MTDQQIRKGHIRAFMRNHYTDERLAMLLAHARDGKLAFMSCCCFIGVATSDHALQSYHYNYNPAPHKFIANRLEGAALAENSYFHLVDKILIPLPSREMVANYNAYEILHERTDAVRRRILIPMIRAEMKRREAVRINSVSQTELTPVLA